MKTIALIAITTFFIEISIALFILLKFKKVNYKYLLILFILFLSFYQLFEFFLCQTSNLIFGKLEFISFTPLPVIGLHLLINFFKIDFKYNKFILYILPVFFSIKSIFTKEFVYYINCENFLVTNFFIFSNKFAQIWDLFYNFYYYGFILIILIILIRKYIYKKEMSFLFLIVFLIPIILLILILIINPILYVNLPSIYCHLSIFSALILLVLVIKLNKNSN